jgi:hypothetical protein
VFSSDFFHSVALFSVFLARIPEMPNQRLEKAGNQQKKNVTARKQSAFIFFVSLLRIIRYATQRNHEWQDI